MMAWFDWIGLVGGLAGLFTILMVTPQVYKTYKTKKTRDLSLLSLWFSIGELFLWGLYGGLIQDKFLVITTSVAGVLYGSLVVAKIRNGEKS